MYAGTIFFHSSEQENKRTSYASKAGVSFGIEQKHKLVFVSFGIEQVKQEHKLVFVFASRDCTRHISIAIALDARRAHGRRPHPTHSHATRRHGENTH